ncbi:MAG: dihydropyrimidinase [Flavobacteriales bacterium CG03_land_8_20_14_0_80_35_15]|nr:dihydropyrimidinase [Zetaproteobacteria bacterium]OIO09392.1 MAG: dihydropyrimidinase [Flavobacteriaceae bacterium CG1_02_35_72]PIR14882.1 MAG: dihydropyrimidinase [Flavobacteriales bacterium CG11_big_fil_rev_8_21_14_0_20_35_7]PIV17452.1 MAG: dihydropyrimidinase [Flavobacteriales bacterium CG03_land_8_20_14_0_80_35_15]PIX08013.1 MAG: dihydropyrimidinase [Flavobacteriales bacterium CG_4_8_14_3_um_filter_35_10]PJA06800.1 MAG: dihydropyrimidinase [Flavobacteriales bacterium CG_4_10_14_0_2_um_f
MSVLIKNGRIINASEDYIADVYTEGEKIVAIGKNLNYKADKVIDATGKLVFPGGIDPHVHLDMPFMGTYSSDNYETGTRAALHGGTTMVIDFILQKQGDTLHNALKTWQQKSIGKAIGDYSYHMAITDFNDHVAKEVVQMIEEEGISSFKTFMAYKGALMIDDGQMVQLMKVVKKHGGIVTVHATNGDMIDSLIAKNKSEGNLAPIYHYLSQPEITEAEASARFTDMLFYTDCPGYIVHMTCEGALNAVRKATQRNQKVFVETCTQYLMLDASLYEANFEGAKWVMSPPLREKKDRQALWSGINQGLVQVVGTDHCPFMWEQKKMGKDDFSKIPNGHPAIEHRLEFLYSEGVNQGKISLTKFVEISSTNAAKIFGMYPRKGTIAIGSDADLVIFNPKKEHTISVKTHHMNCDYSGYEGRKVIGKTETVILRGEIAIENNECLLKAGHGQFIPRTTTSKTVI